MKTAYFDCFAGISGDMCLGALIDAGASADALREQLQCLPVTGWRLDVERVKKRGISAAKVNIVVEEQQEERNLPEILGIIDKSQLPVSVKETAAKIFTRLAEAEAKIHGSAIDRVHFHEVGAVDAIVDVVGTALALHLLGVERVLASPLPTFHGFVTAAHGTFPLPAPATLELIKQIPLRERDIEGELVTPTGAAIITSVADSFGPLPSMNVSAIGYGAGSEDRAFPNVLRVMIGEEQRRDDMEDVRIVECNIDDLNPEFYEVVMARLFAEGALDVYLTPVQMKKTRPGTVVTVLCPPDAVDRMAEIFFRETSTIGVRITEAQRLCLARTASKVETRYGSIRIKISQRDGEVLNTAPEYEDCKSAAEAHRVPVKEVYAAALAAYRASTDGS